MPPRRRGAGTARLAEEGTLLVVKRIELDYHFPLRSRDYFQVDCQLERISPLRFGFNQKIIRLPDQKVIVSAKVIGTCINQRGRPFLPPEIDKAFTV